MWHCTLADRLLSEKLSKQSPHHTTPHHTTPQLQSQSQAHAYLAIKSFGVLLHELSVSGDWVIDNSLEEGATQVGRHHLELGGALCGDLKVLIAESERRHVVRGVGGWELLEGRLHTAKRKEWEGV
jgi:hypothetical protein